MNIRRGVLALFVLASLVAAPLPLQAGAPRPAGVPDLTDPTVLAQFIPLGQGGLNRDPDFPVLLFANAGEGFPQFVLVVVHARNGRETWSLSRDPAVFYLLWSDATTVQEVFLDRGFAESGMPSGRFIAGGPEAFERLLMGLGEGYHRSRALPLFEQA